MVYPPSICAKASHSPSACDESKPCQSRVTVQCACGLQKQEVCCLATSCEHSRGLMDLPCTELCARTKRNRKLAEALDIDTGSSFHEPENVKGGYPIQTLDFYSNNRSWCLEIETALKEFLKGAAMRYAFKPMNAPRRDFVRELAGVYGLDAESVDHEPFRSVEIHRNNRAALPRLSLAEAAKLRNPNTINASAFASSGLVQMRKHVPGLAYNAIYLEGVKSTVLQAELQAGLNPILRPSKVVFSLKVLLIFESRSFLVGE